MFTIYSRTTCAGCDTAKTLLDQHGENYIVKNIETDLDARAEFKELFPTARSVPMIVYEDVSTFVITYEKITTLEDLYKFVM